jgi:hypothetical protein
MIEWEGDLNKSNAVWLDAVRNIDLSDLQKTPLNSDSSETKSFEHDASDVETNVFRFRFG